LFGKEEKMENDFNRMGLAVHATGDSKQWYMAAEEVARGYRVSPVTVRRHLQEHASEIRDGVERGVHNMNTPGGTQKTTILYREGVIKLGFFIRSKQAAFFRQWATNLVVQHLDRQGVSIQKLFNDFKNDIKEEIAGVKSGFQQDLKEEITGVRMVCQGLRDEVDEIKAMFNCFVSDTDENNVRDLIKQVKAVTGYDGRKIVGEVRKALNLATIYDPPHVRLVTNALKNMLGTGLKVVETQLTITN